MKRPKRADGEREAIAATRQRYYDALDRGHSIYEAAEIAERREAPGGLQGRDGGDDPGSGGGQDRAAILIPDDWRSLAWPAKQKLAAALTDEKVKSKADADGAIEAELARRVATSASAT